MSAPLAYLNAAGERANTILSLTWFTLIISVLVCVVIGQLLWIGIRRGRFAAGASQPAALAVKRGTTGLSWIGIGMAIAAVPLAVTLIWTMVALGATVSPPADPALQLDVIGHQWWWEIRYVASPDQSFVTANEIHIPVHERVLVRLHGGDVIHSFWVPKLSGKTDAIPGQTNVTWLEADVPGRYRGQCSEYCGLQHAHMAFEVVAQPAAQFQAWRAQQLRPAATPVSPEQRRGLAVVEYRCGLCHRVGGTAAGALSGPDLTHLGGRRLIAAGTLPNTKAALAGWIENAQHVKPGTLMPNQDLNGPQLMDVLAYLGTLE